MPDSILDEAASSSYSAATVFEVELHASPVVSVTNTTFRECAKVAQKNSKIKTSCGGSNLLLGIGTTYFCGL